MDANTSLLLADHGLQVSLINVKSDSVQDVVKISHEHEQTRDKVIGYDDCKTFIKSFDKDKQQPRLLIFNVAHGQSADDMLKSILVFEQ